MADQSISVIIPSYNSSAYILEAIESVLNQTYNRAENSRLEIIIIDDGSTDDTKAVLKPLIDQKKILYIFQENGGQAKARNSGILQATGKYIAFLDADDVWAPTKTEEQLSLLVKYPDAIAHTGRYIIGGAEVDDRVYSGRITRHLVLNNFIVNSSVMGPANIFKENMFGESAYIRVIEDYELWLRLSLSHDFVYLDKPLTGYRIHPQQSSGDYIPVLNRTIDLHRKLIYRKGFRKYAPLSAYIWIRLKICSIIKRYHALHAEK